MKVSITGCWKEFRTVWWNGKVVKMINQTLLPYLFEIFESEDYLTSAQCIKDMIVRW